MRIYDKCVLYILSKGLLILLLNIMVIEEHNRKLVRVKYVQQTELYHFPKSKKIYKSIQEKQKGLAW